MATGGSAVRLAAVIVEGVVVVIDAGDCGLGVERLAHRLSHQHRRRGQQQGDCKQSTGHGEDLRCREIQHATTAWGGLLAELSGLKRL
ncbi:hypothetical protein D3C80_1929310 [compost metagenome]